jgi:methyl-accepting chemotaxis protein
MAAVTGFFHGGITVSDMDRATQQNAALVDQAGAATDSLNTQAQGLVETLKRFRLA